MKAEAKIIVAIRKRPLTKKELGKNEPDVVDIVSNESLIVKELRQKVDLTKYMEEHNFTFDAVFSESEDNAVLYATLVQPLISSAFERAKVTCFAYGQTGSGKTFTMMGHAQSGNPGLYLLAATDIFAMRENPEHENLLVGISFYDIYCGRAHDLLNNREQCAIRVDAKDNVNIVGLTEKIIANTESLMALITFGLSARITGTTGMNDDSSRSHAILQITLRRRDNGKLHGKMSFIDLAGSERGADVTDTNKQTRLDGAEINKSLLALKECIRALDLDKKHLPFRGSKLTLVLKDSFVGNCKTVMIGNVSPAQNSCEHTLNTLRYADRVKELKKSGEAKERDGKDALARALMLPRMNKNSNKVAIGGKSIEDNIVFEAYDVTGNADKNKATMDEMKKNVNVNPLDKVPARPPRVPVSADGPSPLPAPKATVSSFIGKAPSLQPGGSISQYSNSHQTNKNLNDFEPQEEPLEDDIEDLYPEDNGDEDIEDLDDEGSYTPPPQHNPRPAFFPPQKSMAQNPVAAPMNFIPQRSTNLGANPNTMSIDFSNKAKADARVTGNFMNGTGSNFRPGQMQPSSDNTSLLGKNALASSESDSHSQYNTQVNRPPTMSHVNLNASNGNVNSSAKSNNFLNRETKLSKASSSIVQNNSGMYQDREIRKLDFARNTNLNPPREPSNDAQVLDVALFERVVTQQDELVEDHSEAVDDLVLCVKHNMEVLHSLKESRKLSS